MISLNSRFKFFESSLLIVSDCFKNENNAEISVAIRECQK